MSFQIFTSNFARASGVPNAVSIAISPPYWWHNRLRYLPLAPDRSWLDLSSSEYDCLFFARLANLDAGQVLRDLQQLVSGQDSAILLCFESPGVRCHRRAVADFLSDALGIRVAEVGFPQTPRYELLPTKPERPKLAPKLLFDEEI